MVLEVNHTQSILNGMNQPVCVVSGHSGSILYTNNSFDRNFIPYQKSEVLDSKFQKLFTFVGSACSAEVDLLDLLDQDIDDSKIKYLEFNHSILPNIMQNGSSENLNEQNSHSIFYQAHFSRLDDNMIVLLTQCHLPRYVIEDAFLRNHEVIADFLENAPIAIHSCSNTGYYLWANKSEYELLGYSYEHRELVGYHVNQGISECDREKFQMNVVQGKSGKRVFESKFTITGKDSQPRDVSVKANLRLIEGSSSGEFSHTRSFIFDDADRKWKENAETLQRKKSEQKSITASRDLMFRKLFHELKTPLQVVIASIEDNSPSFRETYADETIQNLTMGVNTLLGTLQDMRIISDPNLNVQLCETTTASSESMWKGSLSLLIFVQSVENMVRSTCIRDGQTCEFEFEGFDGQIHFAAAEHLECFRRALYHLMRNAVENSPDNSKVRLELTHDKDKYSFIIVNESMSIIPSNFLTCLQKIERKRYSFQDLIDEVDNTLESKNSISLCSMNHGIGLSVVKRIAELLNGKFLFRTYDAKMVRCTFTVPSTIFTRMVKMPSALSISNMVQNKKSTYNVLLVDDSILIQKTMSKALADRGHNFTCARNGQDAIDKLTKGDGSNGETYDAIFMDVRMPVMDGIQATEAIRKMEKFANTPIFVISADTTSSAKQEAMQVGASEFFEKPIRVNDVLGLLKRKYM